MRDSSTFSLIDKEGWLTLHANVDIGGMVGLTSIAATRLPKHPHSLCTVNIPMYSAHSGPSHALPLFYADFDRKQMDHSRTYIREHNIRHIA